MRQCSPLDDPARRRPNATAEPQLHSGPRADWAGLGLLLAILGHISLGLVAFFVLARLAGEALWGDWSHNLSGIFARYWLATVLSLLALRMGWHLWEATSGLLTARLDESDETAHGVPLARASHEELYEIVAEVSRHVGVPMPNEIRAIHQPACYAVEWRRFALSTRRRLVIGIGLPLLAVFSVSELKVLLAHELAHIGLGHTRCETFLFRFLRILNTKIERLANRWWRWGDPVYGVCRVSFHILSRMVTPLRHRQELQADEISAAAYGGQLAAHTLLKDWLLGHAFTDTAAMLASKGWPPDRAPQSTVFHRFAAHWHEFSQSSLDYLGQRLAAEEPPSSRDSHPTVSERLQIMRPFTSEAPRDARAVLDLVPDFDALAEQLEPQVLAEDRDAEPGNGKPEVRELLRGTHYRLLRREISSSALSKAFLNSSLISAGSSTPSNVFRSSRTP